MTTSPALKEIEVKTPPKRKVMAKKSYNPGSAIRSRMDRVNTFSSRNLSRPKSQIEEIKPNKTPPRKNVV